MTPTCMFAFSDTPAPFSHSFPKTQSGPGSSRVRDFSQGLSSELVPVPDPCRDALVGLQVSGPGECRMLHVQTGSTGLSAGQGKDLCQGTDPATSREKREQSGKSTFAKSHPLIYKLQRSKCGWVALSYVLGH